MASAAIAPSNSPVFSPSIFCKTPPFSGLSVPSLPPQSPVPLILQPRCGAPGKDRGNSAMERKRPPRIAVPAGFFAGVTDMEPQRAKEEEEEEVADEGDGYGVYSKRGRKRGRLEDRYSAVLGLQGESDQAFFGVFDGHGGAKAAEFAAKNMGKNIMGQMRKRSKSSMEEAVIEGYLETDAKFLDENVDGGSCCVTALIREGNLIVSNAGDCRVVLSRDGTAEALTSDHKASAESERERIEESGGYVDYCHGVWRIQGSLAVSRGIGDKHLKQWVIAEPETKVLRIAPDHEFLILASDGLWDKVTNQEAVDIVRPSLTGLDKPNPFLAAKKLAQLSIRRGSTDDVTVLIIKLDRFISQLMLVLPS
ncbi:hypothetical protein CRG98_040014 [Punica granatum]|uniref:protein-serine/threonine phosphatase n=1 Tax=Punica granatum TaxID=22663 RepID=A0A2I0I6A8_PUNGR|nr:hypothetical protein CRG98_040014 [Punica granatum]